MKQFDFLKMVVGAGLLGTLVACSPASQNAVTLGAESSSIIGGSWVEQPDSIAKSTVALVTVARTHDGKDMQAVCTGSYIGSNIVLTAAHCVPVVGKTYAKAVILVVFGTDITKAAKEDVRVVTKYEIHPKYGKMGENGEDAHDVALVKFSGPVADGYVAANLLKDESLLKPRTVVTLAGFGINKTDGKNTQSDNRLSKTTVEVVGEFGMHEMVLDQSRGQGACHGDSGGPAFLEVDGVQYVWGITSRGSGKDGVDDCSLVSIYTKIKSESDFLFKAVNALMTAK